MFSEQFNFESGAIVNFVGGGGKTGLILTLLEEAPGPIVYTTTTRIHPPHPADRMVVIGCDDPELLKCMLENSAKHYGDRFNKYVAAGSLQRPNLMGGVAATFASALDRGLFPLILNEADGARSMSIKMPRQNEPVLMEAANVLVPVIGLDCVNKPLGPQTIFRWELASERCSLKEGGLLSAKTAASILMHRAGVCKGWLSSMHIIPFINKVDRESDEPLARELAHEILSIGNFPVDKVVIGSVFAGRAASVGL